MRVSISWLRQLVKVEQSPSEIADLLTMSGLEVEEATAVAPPFAGVCVAHVRKVEPHPNAEKLKICEVEVGLGNFKQIVCGAPNVEAGMRVPCAVVGARLPGLEIFRARLRGVDSEGMLCSASELGLSSDHSGLLALPADAPVGADLRDFLDLDDTVLTLKVTPNRGDCLSMRGIARDLAAVSGAPLIFTDPEKVSPNSDVSRRVAIEEKTACGAYFGRVISGIDLSAKVPAWMRDRLERAGLRSVSPLVDITNYVMLERGQPMHAFDNDKIEGDVCVRFAQSGEALVLLNGTHIALTRDHLVIADRRGPLALAGVMGGQSSMCTGGTRSVYFEAAWFNPDAVRGKARTLGIPSDAAYRFERGVDPRVARESLEMASSLVMKICGTSVTQIGPIVWADGVLPERTPCQVRRRQFNRLVGYEIDSRDMVRALESVGCEATPHADHVVAVAPSHRFDLVIEAEFIEEVARIRGYGTVPDRMPVSTLPMLPIPENRREKHAIRQQLAGLGYAESINYSFVDEEWERDFSGNSAPVRLKNPIASQMAVMRTSLIGGLVHALNHNLKQGESRAKLFELGRCFLGVDAALDVQPERVAGISYGARFPEQWGEGGQNSAPVDLFSVKGDVEQLVGQKKDLKFVPATHPAFHPGRCARIDIDNRPSGWTGELHPLWVQKYGLKRTAVCFELNLAVLLTLPASIYIPFSRMQALRRDIAVFVSAKTPVGEMVEQISALNIHNLREVGIFDTFAGTGVPTGQKSVAFRVVMQDTDRTLTDIEADAVVCRIVEVLGEKFGATLRK